MTGVGSTASRLCMASGNSVNTAVRSPSAPSDSAPERKDTKATLRQQPFHTVPTFPSQGPCERLPHMWAQGTHGRSSPPGSQEGVGCIPKKTSTRSRTSLESPGCNRNGNERKPAALRHIVFCWNCRVCCVQRCSLQNEHDDHVTPTDTTLVHDARSLSLSLSL